MNFYALGTRDVLEKFAVSPEWIKSHTTDATRNLLQQAIAVAPYRGGGGLEGGLEHGVEGMNNAKRVTTFVDRQPPASMRLLRRTMAAVRQQPPDVERLQNLQRMTANRSAATSAAVNVAKEFPSLINTKAR